MVGLYVCTSVKIACPIDFKIGSMIPETIGQNVKSIATLESLPKSPYFFLKCYTSSFYMIKFSITMIFKVLIHMTISSQ